MMEQTITLRDVKKIQLTPCKDINEKCTRDVVVHMKDGSVVTLELWTEDQDFPVEVY